jgi:hypothetical protein
MVSKGQSGVNESKGSVTKQVIWSISTDTTSSISLPALFSLSVSWLLYLSSCSSKSFQDNKQMGVLILDHFPMNKPNHFLCLNGIWIYCSGEWESS